LMMTAGTMVVQAHEHESSQALPACSVNMMNSTGYTLLQTMGNGSTATYTQFPTGTAFTVAFAGNTGNQGYQPTSQIALIPTGGARNHEFMLPSLGKTCPASTVVYAVTLDANNNIQVTPPAAS